MGVILVDVINKEQTINVGTLKSNTVKLANGLISPANKEDIKEYELVENHTSEPIKNIEDIRRISKYLIENGRYRDNLMFIAGINFGLRISDLRMVRFCDIINDNLTFKDTFPVFEKKTRTTKKKKVNRYVTINDAVIQATTLYLENTDNVKLSDFILKSESNRHNDDSKPMAVYSINRILTGIANDLSLNIHFSTHSLRKTFCYHQMVMSNNDPRKLLLLQKMLNHSSHLQTLQYIGITDDEIYDAYKKLNLGGNDYQKVLDSNLIERDIC